MALYQCEQWSPSIGEDVFIAASSDIIGQVYLGDHSSVWYNTVIRGDIAPIYIGHHSNVQDLSMLHITRNIPLKIGNYVTIGHSVTLHSCIIEDRCLIGMGATILDGAVIGAGSLVAAGTLVPPGKVFPPGSFIMGSPALLKRELTEKEKETYGQHYKSYTVAKEQHLKTVCLIEEKK